MSAPKVFASERSDVSRVRARVRVPGAEGHVGTDLAALAESMKPPLDQFTHSLFWMMVPVIVLAGFANALGKRRKRRGRSSKMTNRNGTVSRRKSHLVNDLVLAPWWVSFGLAVLLFLVLSALPSPIRMIAPPFAFLFLCISGLSLFRARKTASMLDRQTGLESLLELSSKRFEDLLGEAYRRQGYKVKETLGGGADGGVDLVLRRDGQQTLVQCKRWNGRAVPVQTVRELYGVLHDRGAVAAKLVATTTFTPDAVAFAAGKPIELVGSDALLELLRGVQTTGNIVAPIPTAEKDKNLHQIL